MGSTSRGNPGISKMAMASRSQKTEVTGRTGDAHVYTQGMANTAAGKQRKLHAIAGGSVCETRVLPAKAFSMNAAF